jgi:hypothetical protein
MTSNAGSGATFTNSVSVNATTNRLAGNNIPSDPDGNMMGGRLSLEGRGI